MPMSATPRPSELVSSSPPSMKMVSFISELVSNGFLLTYRHLIDSESSSVSSASPDPQPVDSSQSSPLPSVDLEAEREMGEEFDVSQASHVEIPVYNDNAPELSPLDDGAVRGRIKIQLYGKYTRVASSSSSSSSFLSSGGGIKPENLYIVLSDHRQSVLDDW